MRLCEIIRSYRLEHQISMGEFSRLSGISKPYVSMLESNKISHAVKIPLNYLLRMFDGGQIVNLNLTEDEIKLLTGYRGLNSEGKKSYQFNLK